MREATGYVSLLTSVATGFDAGWVSEFQCAEDGVQAVAADITQRAGAEVPPATPLEWQVRRMIRTRRGRAEPHIPIERVGNGRGVGRSVHALRPVDIVDPVEWAIGPDVDLVNLADGSVPDRFAQQAHLLAGLALVAHLRRDLVLARRLRHRAGLIHGVRQRFLAVDMLTAFDGCHGGHRVAVVRRRDDHSVDVRILLVQHFPEVFVLPGVRVASKRSRCVAPVHVAQGDNVLALECLQVPGPLTSHADARDVQLFARWRLTWTAQHMARNHRERRHTGGRAQESTS